MEERWSYMLPTPKSAVTIRIDGIGGKTIPASLPLLPPGWVEKCMDLNIDDDGKRREEKIDQVLERLTDLTNRVDERLQRLEAKLSDR